MMAHKHLHELLNEDQEPFHLKDYIAQRKSQLKTSQNRPQIPKKCKTTPRYPNCFLSVQYSPDIRNSPLIEFRSPAPTKSPNKCPKSVPIRLQVPTRTAALLFEAAIKIQTQKKSRNQIKNIGFNLFGSILKKLSANNRTRKSKHENAVAESKINGNNRGLSATSSRDDSSWVWSESNEDKSISTEYFEREDFGTISPFRFALQNCSSPTNRTPMIFSPAMSPNNRKIQENENFKYEELEEEGEQFSPVSVLDPPFEDDGNDDVDNYDIECSYEYVERAKQQLLHKLRRFEELAELDSSELEKRMLDEEEIEELEDSYEENKIDKFVNDVLGQVDISRDMKQLVLDLINEENRGGYNDDVKKMISKKFDSWKEVKPNTIDMMVEFDFRLENEEWKGNSKVDIAEIGSKIEVAMFELLVEELWEELF